MIKLIDLLNEVKPTSANISIHVIDKPYIDLVLEINELELENANSEHFDDYLQNVVKGLKSNGLSLESNSYNKEEATAAGFDKKSFKLLKNNFAIINDNIYTVNDDNDLEVIYLPEDEGSSFIGRFTKQGKWMVTPQEYEENPYLI